MLNTLFRPSNKCFVQRFHSTLQFYITLIKKLTHNIHILKIKLMAWEFIYNLKPINNYTDNSESNL